MKPTLTYRLLILAIASVWLANGLLCKILNLVPRHQQIIASILGDEHSRLLTLLIGVAEVIMALWILSRFKSKINAILQMLLVSVMNVLEFILVPDVLLWGKLNALFAVMFIVIIYYTEFIINHRTTH